MIAAILITALVLLIIGVWLLVLVLETMADIRKACRAYVARGMEKPREFSKPPMAPSPPSSTAPYGWDPRRKRT